MCKMTTVELVKKCRNSAYLRAGLYYDTELDTFIDVASIFMGYLDIGISFKVEYTEDKDFLDTWLDKATPSFQRANDKWSEEMQISFIQNLLKGYATTILFFRVGESDIQLIDGLQRTTAIFRFLKGEFKIFDDFDIVALKKDIKKFRQRIGIEIYTFNNMKEAVEFYIEMNENITHSKEDILKAKNFIQHLE